MTTIAWDGTTLAADRAAWSGGQKYRVKKVHKITAPDGRKFLVALCGDGQYATLVLAWMRGGPHPGAYPDNDNIVIAVSIDERRRIWRLSSAKLCYERVLEKIHATGAGQDFAIGALEAGATAKQAVLITARRSDLSALGVDCVTFDD